MIGQIGVVNGNDVFPYTGRSALGGLSTPGGVIQRQYSHKQIRCLDLAGIDLTDAAIVYPNFRQFNVSGTGLFISWSYNAQDCPLVQLNDDSDPVRLNRAGGAYLLTGTPFGVVRVSADPLGVLANARAWLYYFTDGPDDYVRTT